MIWNRWQARGNMEIVWQVPGAWFVRFAIPKKKEGLLVVYATGAKRGKKRTRCQARENVQPVQSAGICATSVKHGKKCNRCKARENGTRNLVLLNRNYSVWLDWLVNVILCSTKLTTWIAFLIAFDIERTSPLAEWSWVRTGQSLLNEWILAFPADFAGAYDIITNLAKEREPGIEWTHSLILDYY